jgi:hypothetical protein
MNKLLRKLWMVGIALILALSTATVAYGRGNIPEPTDPRPPTPSVSGGGNIVGK